MLWLINGAMTLVVPRGTDAVNFNRNNLLELRIRMLRVIFQCRFSGYLIGLFVTANLLMVSISMLLCMTNLCLWLRLGGKY